MSPLPDSESNEIHTRGSTPKSDAHSYPARSALSPNTCVALSFFISLSTCLKMIISYLPHLLSPAFASLLSKPPRLISSIYTSQVSSFHIISLRKCGSTSNNSLSLQQSGLAHSSPPRPPKTLNAKSNLSLPSCWLRLSVLRVQITFGSEGIELSPKISSSSSYHHLATHRFLPLSFPFSIDHPSPCSHSEHIATKYLLA